MIKHWSQFHGDYLNGYHIEVLAIKVFNGNLDDVSWNVHWFFQQARPLLANSLFYDLGNVDDYLSYADRLEVLKRFDTAISKSSDAWLLTYNGRGDHKTAITNWKQIFGDKYPAYG